MSVNKAFSLCVLVLLALASSASAAEDRWQGQEYPRQEGPAHRPDVFLVTDTGGSGGGFGRGDPHEHLFDVDFWNGQRGWACGYGGLFKTADGGLTWERVKPRGGWMHVRMAGPEEIWLLEGNHPGGPGRTWLWHSSDNGRSWRETAHGKMPGYLDFYCRGGVIWVVGGWLGSPGAPVQQSSDNGRTWRDVDFQGLLIQAWRVAIPADHALDRDYAVYVLGLGMGADGKWQLRIVKSLDGGRKWANLPLPKDLSQSDAWNFGQLHFSTSQTGWLGLDKGRLLSTGDGGQTWHERKLPTRQGIAARGAIPWAGALRQ